MTDTVETQPEPQPSVAEAIATVEEAIAYVGGEAFTQLPDDLYIPPEALQVFLEAFQGPLDLLLYLIKKQNVDVLDIPIAKITAQYMEYVDLMKDLQLELAAEYLVMAAMLAEIKSRMLLPRPESVEDEEDDPRAELIRRLQEYERFKTAAENLHELPQLGRDYYVAQPQDTPEFTVEKPLPEVKLKEIVIAMQAILHRAKVNEKHHVQLESISMRERMSDVLHKVSQARDSFLDFQTLFNADEGRTGVVVTFCAILELLKQSLIEIIQKEPFSPIHVRAKVS